MKLFADELQDSRYRTRDAEVRPSVMQDHSMICLARKQQYPYTEMTGFGGALSNRSGEGANGRFGFMNGAMATYARGRKKGSRNRKVVIHDVLFEAVTVREGGCNNQE